MMRMKRWIKVSMLTATAFIAFQWAYAQTEQRELFFLNWTEYMDPQIIKEFEQEFNAKVVSKYYESGVERNEMMVQTQARGLDVVLIGGSTVESYTKRGWTTPVGLENVPNLKHVAPRWRKAFPKTEEYGVPYMWGTTGIVYRKDLVPEEVDSWKQFFYPKKSLQGKIQVIRDNRSTVGFALKALGYSLNSTDLKAIKEAENLLLQHKPFVQTYGGFKFSEETGIVTGKIWMGQTYNGAALKLQEYHPQITYVLPREGGQIWLDSFVVLKHAPNKELAMQFLNFLNEPRIAARLSMFTKYATANEAAEAFLPKEHLANPAIYPPKEAIENSEFEHLLPPRIQKKFNAVFAKLIQ